MESGSLLRRAPVLPHTAGRAARYTPPGFRAKPGSAAASLWSMTRIGLLSDTHSYLDERILHHLQGADEIWHAGDFGSAEVLMTLAGLAPVFRGVYGNIDGPEIRSTEPLMQDFTVEGLRVLMTHIGGYPGRYVPAARQLLAQTRPGLFVTGHSHILRVAPDARLNLLHLNPGAAGMHGFHKVRTLLRFGIHNGQVVDMQAVELGPRSLLPPAK